jgi:hypothetical protein
MSSEEMIYDIIMRDDLEKFKMVKKELDIDTYLTIIFQDTDIDSEIQDYVMRISSKYYNIGIQRAFENGNVEVLEKYNIKGGLKKNGFKNTLKSLISDNEYEFMDYVLDNNIETVDELIYILCLINDSLDVQKFKSVFKQKRNKLKKVNMSELFNCSNFNIDVYKFIVSQGIPGLSENIIKKRIQETEKKKVPRWINSWISDSSTADKELSSTMIKELGKTIKKDNYTVYKGLVWEDRVLPELGSEMILSFPAFSSTSVNPTVAKYFANVSLFDIKANYGMIIKLNITKKDILADLTHMDNGSFRAYEGFATNQSEIILKPNDYNVKIIYVRDHDSIDKL